ncbi:hypothetical protein KUV59_03280 [Marinobacter daepoensis]|uniref:hypothetical protein n=1 Tax=Marinobacter daepoensis TaxID=262077 RepID=UPI001C98C271|nr:hypothetical protein [Marinobacter daepoensis]MBY6032177.1 hypothetical protein [Marinobacter daepoensis]
MTFIAGWLPSDLNNPSNDNIAGPDSVAIKGPTGGFLVPAGATVSNIGFHSKNAVPAKFSIYAIDFTLLAETGGATTGGAGDELFPLLTDWTPQVDTYVYVAALTSSYLTGIGGDANLRFMPYASRVYEDGFPNPFVQAGTANTPKQALWLDGTLAASGPSIPEADDITDESQPVTFTLSGNENAPTGITINGEVGSNLIFVSENTGAGTETYSYEPPLIADDDTTDLVVSVDGATAATVIAYTNSYDRDQLTHPATEAEYSENSLSYPNAYATTQPYEWKVVTDANASVVTINWNALEADDGFHKDVASYATPVANGSTTVTLGVFVPETGQAYQFDRTITVSDGSVVVTGEGLWCELFRDPTEELFTELFR